MQVRARLGGPQRPHQGLDQAGRQAAAGQRRRFSACTICAAPPDTLMSRLGVAEDIAELAIGHVRADLVARYNKDDAWEGRRDAFTKVSDHVATLIGAREGAAVIPLRG